MAENRDSMLTLLNLGTGLLQSGRSKEALDSLLRGLPHALPGDSNLSKLYALLARASTDLAEPEVALNFCRQGLEVSPGDPELLFQKGVLQLQLMELEDAEQCFVEIVERESLPHPASSEKCAYAGKAWHNLALVCEQRQQFDRAAQAWRHVLEHDSLNTSAWRGLLHVLVAGGSVDGLKELSSPEPGHYVPPAVRSLARAQLAVQHGNRMVAVAELGQAAKEELSLEFLGDLCELAFKNGLLEIADRGLAELARRSPGDPSACHNRGLVLLRRGEYAEAVRWARRSLHIRPNYGPSRCLLEEATRLMLSHDLAKSPVLLANVRIGESLIGDALFTEPAIRALAMVQRRRIPLLLHGPPTALFQGHPDVSLVTAESEAPGDWVQLDPMTALKYARMNRCHICCGFFPQLGLSPVGADCKPRLWHHGVDLQNPASRGNRNRRIALAPFSASCMVHRTGVANKTIAVDWWDVLARQLPLPSDSFGALQEPTIECSDNFRGLSLDEVSAKLRCYELLITTDNGVCAIAGALNCNIVLLESASAPWLTGPQTGGKLEVVYSGVPPTWRHDDVLTAVQRILQFRVQ